MGDITLKNNKELPIKKKKKNIGLRIFLITLSVIIGLPLIGAGVLLILAIDKSHKELDVQENMTNEQVFENALVDALDDTKTSKKINFSLK